MSSLYHIEKPVAIHEMHASKLLTRCDSIV